MSESPEDIGIDDSIVGEIPRIVAPELNEPVYEPDASDDLVQIKRKHLASLLEDAYIGAAYRMGEYGGCHCCRDLENCPDCQAFEAAEPLVREDPNFGFVANPFISVPVSDREKAHRREVHGKHYEESE